MRVPFLPLPRPRRRKRDRSLKTLAPYVPPAPPPPPAALVLVGAEYATASTVRLTFDRAIDISALNGPAVVVDDGADTGNAYRGTGYAVLVTPASAELDLVLLGPASGSGTTLSATAASGIVAVNDGGTWAGVISVALPLP
ncbi:MAG: hypothetical protein QOE14_605 [Humisphaera sp.]|nr:hypothetical protein [Humisphaera sp.]